MIDRLEFTLGRIVYGITKANLQSSRKGFSISTSVDAEREAVQAHRRQLASELGFTHVCTQKQVHGIAVQWVDEQSASDEVSDALITTTPDVLLCASVADCCGVVMWSTSSSVVAAVHSGWRGTQQAIVRVVLEMIANRGVSAPSEMCAWLSPCASGRSYVVRRDVQQYFSSYCREIAEDQFLFDNTAAIRDQLVQSGVKAENIQVSGICTIEDSEYHSYRRDGESSGRMAAFIGVRA